MIRLAALAVGIAMSLGTAASAQPKRICPELMPGGVDPAILERLSRGVNLAGWMDSFASPRPDPAILRALRKYGFTHVRLPVPAEGVMQRFTPDADVRRQLGKVSDALAELTGMGFAVSIDLHPGGDFNRLHRSDPAAALQAAKDGWRDLASVMRPFPPDRVYAELLNEPEVEHAQWHADATALAIYLRSLLPRTPLIVGPAGWQRADSLPGFDPLPDLNVVYALHFYDPMVFTHQGHWDPDSTLSEVRQMPYPIDGASSQVQAIRRHLQASAPAEVKSLDEAIAATRQGDLIAQSLQPAIDWQRKHRRPIIINEFGVLKAEAPPDSRTRWLKSVVTQAENVCWGWAHWELEQGFGLVDAKTKRLDDKLIKLLTAPSR